MAIFLPRPPSPLPTCSDRCELNDWNGQFFDAVGRKDLSGFVHDLWTFLVIIAVLLALTVAQTFLQERLKFRLREWIARHLLVEWLKPLRVYQLELCRPVRPQPGPAHPGGYAPARRLQRRSRLRHRLFPASDHRFRRGAVGLVGAGHVPGGGLRHRHSRLHGLVRPRLCLDRLRSDLARGTAADCPEWRAICARGRIPLRPRSGQRIRREHRAAWRGEGRTTASRGRARGCRGYHAADIFLARPPHLDHIGHGLAVARRSDTRGRAGLFRRHLDPRRAGHGGRRLYPGARRDAMVRR